jgi:hypothetical protein
MTTLRVGDLYKKLGKEKTAANFYFKTANIFAAQGHTTKAAATYKMILRLDPSLEEVQEKLDELTAAERETSSTRIRPVPRPGAGYGSIDVAPVSGGPPVIEMTGSASDPPPIERTIYSSEPPPIEVMAPAMEAPIGLPSGPPYENDPSAVDFTFESTAADTDESYDQIELAPATDFVPGCMPGSASIGDNSPDGTYCTDDDGSGFVIERTSTAAEPVRPDFDPELDEGLIGGTTYGMDELPASPPGGDIFDGFASKVEAPVDGQPTVEIPDAPPRKESELFLGIEEEDLWELLGRMDRLTFGPGEDVIREGDSGGSIYIISNGKVSVSTTIAGKVVQLAELGEQDFFGEVSFLTGRPRTATVTAIATTTIMELKRSEVDDLISKNPEIESVLKMFHENRVADTLSTMKTAAKGFF